MRACAALPPALVAALLIAGCGPAAGGDSAGEFTGPAREVAATVEALQEAAGARDAQRICARVLAPDVLRRMRAAGTSCVPAVEDALLSVDVTELTVREGQVRVQGPTASARVTVGNGENPTVTTFQLVRARDGWRIAGFGA
ncbi:MAG TPA: hypothetical protein VGV40_13465 [Solirubrobacteraceae bacterium]|nr:hypothetical protein [Solirubrobacteraceae bacterium]